MDSTKHIYIASQRIASKLGNIDAFGADPRRVERARNIDFEGKWKAQTGAISDRHEALGFEYYAKDRKSNFDKDSTGYASTGDSKEAERLVFFYHPDHLGSTSYVTDLDGNVTQHIEYIPYGEVFIEEKNNAFATSYLFNAKELDEETGMYYYGARYLEPQLAMWISVDPLWEKYVGMSPYNYCAGNPVRLVDVDGKKFDEAGEKYINEEFIPNGRQLIEKYRTEQDKLSSRNTQVSIRRRKALLDRIIEVQKSLEEVKRLKSSDQLYLFDFNYIGEKGITDYEGKTSYDKHKDAVLIFVKGIQNLVAVAHELKHCYQFEKGKLSFLPTGVPGRLYDYQDEVEAHRRGYAFGANSSTPDATIYGKLSTESLDVTKEYVDEFSKKNKEIFRYNGLTYNLFDKEKYDLYNLSKKK